MAKHLVADDLVEILNEQLPLLVGHFVPTKVIHVRNKIDLVLMMIAGMRSTSSRKLIFGKLMIAIELMRAICPLPGEG